MSIGATQETRKVTHAVMYPLRGGLIRHGSVGSDKPDIALNFAAKYPQVFRPWNMEVLCTHRSGVLKSVVRSVNKRTWKDCFIRYWCCVVCRGLVLLLRFTMGNLCWAPREHVTSGMWLTWQNLYIFWCTVGLISGIIMLLLWAMASSKVGHYLTKLSMSSRLMLKWCDKLNFYIKCMIFFTWNRVHWMH